MIRRPRSQGSVPCLGAACPSVPSESRPENSSPSLRPLDETGRGGCLVDIPPRPAVGWGGGMRGSCWEACFRVSGGGVAAARSGSFLLLPCPSRIGSCGETSVVPVPLSAGSGSHLTRNTVRGGLVVGKKGRGEGGSAVPRMSTGDGGVGMIWCRGMWSAAGCDPTDHPETVSPRGRGPPRDGVERSVPRRVAPSGHS